MYVCICVCACAYEVGGGEMDGESLSVLMCAYLIGLKARNASFLC